jgi:trk system potassium uptake protein TrkH
LRTGGGILRILIVLKFLSFILFVITGWMLIPLLYSYILGDSIIVMLFAKSIAIGIASGAALYLASQRADMTKMGMKEVITSVTLSWIVASALSSLPYWLGGSAPTYTDAFFEGMSGFTTTGTTIFPSLDSLPRGLLAWRGLTHWLGGMGIIGLTLALMPFAGFSGFQLFSAEAPGMVHEKITPRLQQTAVMLWLIYVVLTILLTLLLLAAGMGGFDAINHAMAAISTGGFSTHTANIAYFDNACFDWILIFFMFISGANFVLYLQALKGRSLKKVFCDPEFRFYLISVSSISILASFGLYINGTSPSFADALRRGSFHAVSFITTTGFVGANYDVWPHFALALLFVCLFLGGCAGSTAGGIKQGRLLVMWRHLTRQISLLISPRAIIPVRLGARMIESSAVSSCMAFFGLYLLVFVMGVFLITLFEPDLLTAISGAATSLGNIGPGFGRLGSGGNYASQASGAKWIYSFLMLCGRLELYTVLTLFSRAYWRDGILLSNETR